MQTTLTVRMPKLHPAQREIVIGARRYNVLDCGRRFGKDITCLDLMIQPALQGYPVAWFNPTYKMLSEVWKETRRRLAPIISRPHEQEKQLELLTGGVIDMWSLDSPDGPRGRKYRRVVINEAAMVKDLMDVWAAVIRPTLADYEGDAFFASTPKGLNGFYQLYRRAQSDPQWAAWHKTTYDNPYIKRAEIEALQTELPERVFRQEILAEFIEDGGFFQAIERAAIVEQRECPEDHAGHDLVMAVDWALSNDYTVLGVGCRECNRVVDWDRFNQLDFTYQRERLYTMTERWQISGCLPERNSIGEPNIEIIMDRVPIMTGPDGRPGFTTSATTKPPLIQGLATALEHRGFQVPTEAADELRSYEVETMASGHPKFSAPAGLHDDWVMMLALLWYAMTSGGISLGIL